MGEEGDMYFEFDVESGHLVLDILGDLARREAQRPKP